MAKTHPHIDLPTVAQLRELVAKRPRGVVETYLALHDLIAAAVPGVACSVDTVDASVGYGAHQFGYNGWGMAALTPYARWASLTLLHGAALADPHKLLTGTATMRHIKLSDPAAVDEHRQAIGDLLVVASRLHE